jgi:uncharacterized protein
MTGIIRKNITWKGLSDLTVEHCSVSISDEGAAVHAVVCGNSDDVDFRVDYSLKTDSGWNTLFLHIFGRNGEMDIDTILEKAPDGSWRMNGKPAPQMNGCTDVDISVTPFTNSLPINRLQLKAGERQKIRVAYFDVHEREVRVEEQFYTRMSETEYLFETAAGDFSATITVDASGLVIDYPGLFKRAAFVEVPC